MLRRTAGRWFGAVAGGLLVASVLTGCSFTQGSPTGSKGYITGDGAVVQVDAALRKPAPQVSGAGLLGGTVRVNHPGEVVVLNVWASWCGPCRAEAAGLAKAARELRGPKGAAFVGIDTRDDAASAKAFVRSHHVPYPSISDPDGSALLPFVGLLNPKALPTTIVIDQHGKVAAVISGPTTAVTLVDIVHQLRGER